jgi:hypothetical protein
MVLWWKERRTDMLLENCFKELIRYGEIKESVEIGSVRAWRIQYEDTQYFVFKRYGVVEKIEVIS